MTIQAIRIYYIEYIRIIYKHYKRKYKLMAILNWFLKVFLCKVDTFLFLQGYFWWKEEISTALVPNWSVGIENQGTKPNPNP